MHRLTGSILDASNYFHNTNAMINERLCVIPSPYYMEWFEKFNPNAHINRYDSPFFLQRMNGIQGKN